MKGAAVEKQEVLEQWPGINTQFTYAGQRLGWAELWTNYVIYFSHVSGPSYSSRCWAKVNTGLAKHTPLLTSLPRLSLGQAPVLSSVLSSGQAQPRKHLGKINKPLLVVSFYLQR